MIRKWLSFVVLVAAAVMLLSCRVARAARNWWRSRLSPTAETFGASNIRGQHTGFSSTERWVPTSTRQ